MAPAAANNIILYHYAYSPYARRLVWYLALRGIPYAQCMQPGIMPRPDVAKLGIKYRRIPILSIGRDVYLDSRLALQKLETAFPDRPKLGASGEQLALERLLESWNVDAGMFTAATQLLPIDLPFLTQPSYYADRGEYLGIKLTREAMLRGRPEGLTKIRSGMEFLESTLLADGREWILKTEGPSLADIEAVWPFHWIAGIPDALPADLFSAERYPKVYAWIARFQAAVSAAKRKVEKPKTLSGDEAMDLILGSPYFESAGPVDKEDPLVTAHGLKKGDGIVVWPTDTGSSHKDTGTLVSIDWREVVFEAKGEKDTVRVHAPRHGFRVRTPRQDNGQASL